MFGSLRLLNARELSNVLEFYAQRLGRYDCKMLENLWFLLEFYRESLGRYDSQIFLDLFFQILPPEVKSYRAIPALQMRRIHPPVSVVNVS